MAVIVLIATPPLVVSRKSYQSWNSHEPGATQGRVEHLPCLRANSPLWVCDDQQGCPRSATYAVAVILLVAV